MIVHHLLSSSFYLWLGIVLIVDLILRCLLSKPRFSLIPDVFPRERCQLGL